MRATSTDAWATAARYTLQAGLIAFLGWLQQIGKHGWDSMSTYDMVFAATAVAVAAMNGLGATINKTWAEAQAARLAASGGAPSATLPSDR